MTGPTPEQIRIIEKKVQEFDKFWYVDPHHKEIRRKNRSWWWKAKDFFWPSRQTVPAMYWWFKNEWLAQGCLQSLTFPLDHDNMPIEGFPMKYALQGNWTIPEGDLRYLTKGPLASADFTKVLVPADLGWQKFLRIVKTYFPAGSALAGFIATLVRFEDELNTVAMRIATWLGS